MEVSTIFLNFIEYIKINQIKNYLCGYEEIQLVVSWGLDRTIVNHHTYFQNIQILILLNDL